MVLKVGRVDVWTGTIEDRPGGAAATLDALSQAGANLEMVLARRAPQQPGKGGLFGSPGKTSKALKAAEGPGLRKAIGIHSLRIQGGDKAGLGASTFPTAARATVRL